VFKVALDTGQRRIFVNIIMKLRVPYNAKNFLKAEQILASQEGHCCTNVAI
jgi:hypothetical protein